MANYTNNMEFKANLIPFDNQSGTLGNDTKKWANIYTDKINGKSVDDLGSKVADATSTVKGIMTLGAEGGAEIYGAAAQVLGTDGDLATAPTIYGLKALITQSMSIWTFDEANGIITVGGDITPLMEGDEY